MKRVFLILVFCCAGAWNAYAIDGLEAGGGVGAVDLGVGGSTWIAYAAGEVPLDISLGDPRIVSSIEARLGTTGTASNLNVSQTLDFFVSGLFKAGYEVTPEFTPYAMAGFSFGSAKTKVGVFSTSSTDTSLSFAAGVEYHLDDRLKIGVDYTAYWSDVKAFAANVMYRF